MILAEDNPEVPIMGKRTESQKPISVEPETRQIYADMNDVQKRESVNCITLRVAKREPAPIMPLPVYIPIKLNVSSSE